MILHGDCVDKLKTLTTETVQLCWTDPPFNTGDIQKHSSGANFSDKYVKEDFYRMIRSCFTEVHRVLKESGLLCVCLDYREVHSVKLILDEIFKPENFRGEIIWHFELGNISKNWWSNKHNTILMYSKNFEKTKFYFDKIPETIRKSPKGTYQSDKKVTSVWNFTLSNSDEQRVKYPNQKPMEIIKPFIHVHTDEGDTILDCFAGSGSVGQAARDTNRKFILIDQNIDSINIINQRLNGYEIFGW